MAKKDLKKLYPKIDGGTGNKFGFNHVSMIPTDSVPVASEGNFYYDDSENALKLCTDGSTWTALGTAAAATTGLDGNYDINPTITVDGATVTLAGSNVDVLTITQSANDDGIFISKAGAGAGYPIKISNSGSGEDIYGTSGTWKVSKAGLATFTNIVGQDLTLTASTVSITGDGTTGVIANIVADTLTSGKALTINMAVASTATLLDILVASSSKFKVTDAGVVTIAGVAEATDALVITAGDIAITDGDLDVGGQVTFVPDANADGFVVTGAATGNYDAVFLNGTTNAGSGHILSISQGAGLRTGNLVDVELGATAVGAKGAYIYSSGGARTQPLLQVTDAGTGASAVGINVTTAMAHAGSLLQFAITGAATGNCIFINNDNGTSLEAINIDDEANTEDIILVNATANTAAGKSLVHLVSDGTPNATGTALFIDWTGITATNTPYAAQISTTGKDAAALVITSGAVTDSTVVITGSGAIANDKAVVEILGTGTPAVGVANLLRVDGSGLTATNVPTLVELIGAGKTVQGLNIDADCTSVPVVLINGGGALTNGLGVLNLTNDGNLAAGGNVLNITVGGTPADATVAAVEIVCAKDCLALDIATSAATTNGVQITGVGAIADNKGVLSVIHSTGTIANGGGIVNITGSTAATATAYGLVINCNAANLEGINVEAGTVLIAETLTVTGAITASAALTVGTTLGVTGAATFTAGAQSLAVARTATADGLTTGAITAGTSYVTVTAGADANSIISLPTPVIGNIIWLHVGATGYELRSSDPATIAINGGAGALAESAIAANTLVQMICNTATTWIGNQWNTAGTLSAVQVAAA